MTRRTLGVVFALGVLMGLALSSSTAHAGTRPGSELQLYLLLNGQETREVLADGGGRGIYVTDAGSVCTTVQGGGVYKLRCDVGCNVCVYAKEQFGTPLPGALASDGGCWDTVTDPNYGPPLAAATDKWMVLGPGTTVLCAHPQSGATLNVPLWLMQ